MTTTKLNKTQLQNLDFATDVEAITWTSIVKAINPSHLRLTGCIASNNLKWSSDSEKSLYNTTWVLKEIWIKNIPAWGVVRVAFDAKKNWSYSWTIQLRRNWIAVWNAYDPVDWVYNNYSQDIPTQWWDSIQIYCNASSAYFNPFVKNFRIYFDIVSDTSFTRNIIN